MIYIDGTYYFYGENKEKTDGKNGIWHWGVRCYASKDLYNWEDKGLIIPPEPENQESSLHPASQMDRPHIIYNRETKKYVAWLKIMNKDGTQTETVLTADEFLGPYTKVREGLKPLNMSAGDFDLAVAPDGKAYYYFERVHSETICADLTADYTDVTGYYSTHFPHPYPPYVREATAHFMRKNRHYLITSGTTGYLPNPSEVAAGDSWHGPFTVLGNPHPADKSNTSFHSQISSVFKVPGKRSFISPVRTAGCRSIWMKNMKSMQSCLRPCSIRSRNLTGGSLQGNILRIYRTILLFQIMYGCRCGLKRLRRNIRWEWCILTGWMNGGLRITSKGKKGYAQNII